MSRVISSSERCAGIRTARFGGGVIEELREIAFVRAHGVRGRVAIELEEPQKISEVLRHDLVARGAPTPRAKTSASSVHSRPRVWARASIQPARSRSARSEI